MTEVGTVDQETAEQQIPATPDKTKVEEIKNENSSKKVLLGLLKSELEELKKSGEIENRNHIANQKKLIEKVEGIPEEVTDLLAGQFSKDDSRLSLQVKTVLLRMGDEWEVTESDEAIVVSPVYINNPMGEESIGYSMPEIVKKELIARPQSWEEKTEETKLGKKVIYRYEKNKQ